MELGPPDLRQIRLMLAFINDVEKLLLQMVELVLVQVRVHLRIELVEPLEQVIGENPRQLATGGTAGEIDVVVKDDLHTE